ncbi:MAG: LCP family protein [Thermoleophilia bacterium]|nr:LCP family protein [Thermoleophilia bacterium]
MTTTTTEPADPPRRRWWRRPRWWLLAAVLLLVAWPVAATLVALQSTSSALAAARDRLPDDVDRRAVARDRSGDALTVLVIGVDRSSSGDGIQLVRAQGTSGLRTLSIPRDLLLDAYDGGERPATLQHQQGPAAVVRAIGRTTGIHIHRVVVIRLTAMRTAIDAVGPVSVENPARLETREIQGRTWTFPKGRIELDGAHAEAFMRARHNEASPDESDEDRSRRQQLVLTAMLGSLSPLDVLLHPHSLPHDLLGSVGTDLTRSELVQLARAARHGVTARCRLTGQLQAVHVGDPNLPWPARRDGLYLVPDPDELADVVAGFEGDGAACAAASREA